MKKFIGYLPVITGLLFSLNVSSQKNKQNYQGSYPEFNLRTSLTSFIDLDAGMMLGVNYRWSDRFSASFEPTWIFYSLYTDRAIETTPSGFKIRSDLRYHLLKRNVRSPDFYIAPEFHYKHVRSEKEDLFGINCQNGQCAYFQNAVYTDIRNEIGGFLKIGLITPMPFVKNNRWLIEMYVGAGAKRLDFKETDLPLGGSFVDLPNRTPFGRPSSGFGLPMLPAGLCAPLFDHPGH